MREQLVLTIERGPNAAFALGAMTARAVGLEQVVAALDRGDLLGVGLRVEARLADSQRPKLVEPVHQHEQGDDDGDQESDPSGV